MTADTPAPAPSSSHPFESERHTGLAIALLAVIMLTITSFPYLSGRIMAQPGFTYSGVGLSAGDTFSYYAKMLQGFDGAWLYSNRYTPEPHEPALLFVFYLALGHLARITGLAIPLVYFLARITGSAMLMWGMDRLARVLEIRGGTRVLFFILGTTAAGLGYFLDLTGLRTNPSEIWWSECYTLHSMLLYPHFVVSGALVLIAMGDLLRYARTPGSRLIPVRLFLESFLLAWVHPRLALTILAPSALCALWGWRLGRWPLRPWIIGAAAVLAGAAGPSIAMVLSYRDNPVWGRWASIPTLTPNPFDFLLTYGLLWPMAFAGARRAWRHDEPWAVFVISWFVAGAVLPYLPILSQRRLVQLYNLPLSMLSAYFLTQIVLGGAGRAGERPARLPLRAGLAFMLCAIPALSSWYYYKQSYIPLLGGKYPWFISDERAEANLWLRAHAGRDETVLCSEGSGMIIPAYAGNRVLLGHWAETPDAGGKTRNFARYMSGALPPGAATRYLDQNRIGYLLMSGAERRIGQNIAKEKTTPPYDPAGDPATWRLAWERRGVEIYRRVIKTSD